MKLKVLGCSGAEFPGHRSPGFLIDESLLLDAGTIGSVLNENEQCRINKILISHYHLDHIKAIPLLADNIIVGGLDQRIRLLGTPETLDGIRRHLFNNEIWPDFSTIPNRGNPVIEYIEVFAGKEFEIDNYSIMPIPVNHSVPAVGYIVRKGDYALLYTGDTGPTEQIWQNADDLSAVIIEASFPDKMEEHAKLTGHLTPLLLGKELAKLHHIPPLILVTHAKPQYYDQIREELQELKIPQLKMLQVGNEYELSRTND